MMWEDIAVKILKETVKTLFDAIKGSLSGPEWRSVKIAILVVVVYTIAIFVYSRLN